MSDEHIYNIHLKWTADRKGLVSSPELPDSIEVATPPPFPKGIPGIWSPEHFFVSAVASCLMTTFLAIAENSKFDFVRFSCDANGTVDRNELGRFYINAVTLKPRLVISDAGLVEKAHRILEKSEKACLISNSIKSTVHFLPEVVVE